MRVIKEVKNTLEPKIADLQFEQADMCPICNTHIVAADICGCIYKHDGKIQAAILNYCSGCQSTFMSTYKAGINRERFGNGHVQYDAIEHLSSDPVCFVADKFSDNITAMSPLFVEIYNQAKQAETLKMAHIAGMGYRKSLEFLVKDYAIHFNPEKAEDIKSMPLAQCIKSYIDNSKIKTLAEKSAWLGNDETHYVRKHADKDIEDLKRFINACIHYIDMELTLEDAEAMPKA